MGNIRQKWMYGEKRNVTIAIMIIAGLLLAVYFSGLIGGMLTTGTIDANPISVVMAFASYQKSRMVFMVILIAAGLLAAYIFIQNIGKKGDDDFLNKQRNISNADTEQYGGAKSITHQRLAEILKLEKETGTENSKEIYFGKEADGKHHDIVTLPESVSKYNRNFIVGGGQGSMKSQAVIFPMIYNCGLRGDGIIVSDPKGELYCGSVDWLKKHGYEVYQFNLKTGGMESSNTWDILGEADGTKNIDIICDTLIKNAQKGKDGDPFFINAETDLLKALCLYVITQNPYGERTLGHAYQLLINKTMEELDAAFDVLREKDPENPAIGPYLLFQKADKAKGAAFISLGVDLKIFQDPLVRRITGVQDIDLIKVAKGKVAIFCIMPDMHSTYDMLTATFISMAFKRIIEDYADRTIAKRCDADVYFILDEFPSIGYIPDFLRKLAVARSRGVGIMMAYQNLPQLQGMYEGTQWETLFSGCDFRMLMGANDTTTSDYYSELTGNSTVVVKSEKSNVVDTDALSSVLFGSSMALGGETSSVGQRKYLLEDEIRRLKPEQMLLFIRGEQVCPLEKYPQFKNPNYKSKLQKMENTYVPKWRQQERDDGSVIDIYTNTPCIKDDNDLYVTDEWIRYCLALFDEEEYSKRWNNARRNNALYVKKTGKSGTWLPASVNELISPSDLSKFLDWREKNHPDEKPDNNIPPEKHDAEVETASNNTEKEESRENISDAIDRVSNAAKTNDEDQTHSEPQSAIPVEETQPQAVPAIDNAPAEPEPQAEPSSGIPDIDSDFGESEDSDSSPFPELDNSDTENDSDQMPEPEPAEEKQENEATPPAEEDEASTGTDNTPSEDKAGALESDKASTDEGKNDITPDKAAQDTGETNHKTDNKPRPKKKSSGSKQKDMSGMANFFS